MADSKEIEYYDNPAHLLQLYVHRHTRSEEFHQHAEWELPEGATIRAIRGGEDVIELPNYYSTQLSRIHGRFVWSKLEGKHLNPAGAPNQAPRLFQFVIKIAFQSRAWPDYNTSILARVTGWSSGARRADNCSKTHMKMGDTFELLLHQGKETECLAARCWTPAVEFFWKNVSESSFWSSDVHGLTIDHWAGFPKVSCRGLETHFAPPENTEFIVSFPNQIIPQQLVGRYLRHKESPPPPPAEASWDENQKAHWGPYDAQELREEDEEEDPEATCSELRHQDAERSSAIRLADQGYLDSVSLDRVSCATGYVASENPSVITAESVAHSYQVVFSTSSYRSS